MTPGRRSPVAGWCVGLLLLGLLASGCADLNERTSLEPTAVPQARQAYLYGRFRLTAESARLPRLYLHLFDLSREASLAVPLRASSPALYVIDVGPGRYQFTQMMFAGEGDVRRDNLQLLPPIDFMGREFEVRAGTAYYVGDWEAELRRTIDFYFVVSKHTYRWGLRRLAFDYASATADLERLYPALAALKTQPAWRDGAPGG